MPRIYSSASDPIDFCRKHFPKTEASALQFAEMGDGPDGRGNCFSYDDDHPPYEDDDSGMYRCHTCKKTLTTEDN